jgi:hypothetical protein
LIRLLARYPQLPQLDDAYGALPSLTTSQP